MNGIPKNFYYIWVGDREKPGIFYQCYNSWEKNMPDYEIVEINDRKFNIDGHLKENRFFAECYRRKLWAYVADYIRVKYLYENGGIFLDIDMEIVKDFTRIPELSETEYCDFFASFESNEGIGLGLFGVRPGSEILKKMIEFYEDEVWKTPFFTLPQIIRYILKEKMGYDLSGNEVIDREKGIYILKKEYFYPFLPHEKFERNMLTDENYAIHWWNHSWKGLEPFLFLKTKHLRGIRKYIKKTGIYMQMFRDFIRNKK